MERKCDGNCEFHTDNIRKIIIGNGHFEGLKFNYCENAILEDERRGFTIIIEDEQPHDNK